MSEQRCQLLLSCCDIPQNLQTQNNLCDKPANDSRGDILVRNKSVDINKISSWLEKSKTPNRRGLQLYHQLFTSPSSIQKGISQLQTQSPSLLCSSNRNTVSMKLKDLPHKNLTLTASNRTSLETGRINNPIKLTFSYGVSSRPTATMKYRQNHKIQTSRKPLQAIKPSLFERVIQTESRVNTESQHIRVEQSLIQSRAILDLFSQVCCIDEKNDRSRWIMVEKNIGLFVSVNKFMSNNKQTLDSIANEANVYKSMPQHRNILQYYQNSVNQGNLMTIGEYYQFSLKAKVTNYSNKIIINCIRDIIDGMKHLQRHGIHHETTVAHLVIVFDICKISDFTEARLVSKWRNLHAHYINRLMTIVEELIPSMSNLRQKLQICNKAQWNQVEKVFQQQF